MATLANAITELNSRRNELVDNLNAMGVEASTSENLMSLVPKVLEIETAGAVESQEIVEPLDPYVVYKNTRPSDWLEMPAVSEGEMYLLFHLSPPTNNLIAFTVGGDYTVEYGTVVNGTFVSSYSESFSSGTTYEATMMYDDFGDETSTGVRQVMFKVSGDSITSFAPTYHSSRNYPAFFAWNIVDIKGNLPNLTSLTIGNSALSKALINLRYFSLEGTNKITTLYYKFAYCISLIAILELDASNVTSLSNAFRYNYALQAVPNMNTSNATTATYAFAQSYSIKALPDLNLVSVTDVSYMCVNCYNLIRCPDISVATPTNITQVFNSCYCLSKIPPVNITKISAATSPFFSCYALTELTFTGSIDVWPAVIVLSYSSFNDDSFIKFAESLPTITSAIAIQLTYTPVQSTITDEMIAIATEKGWAITV